MGKHLVAVVERLPGDTDGCTCNVSSSCSLAGQTPSVGLVLSPASRGLPYPKFMRPVTASNRPRRVSTDTFRGTWCVLPLLSSDHARNRAPAGDGGVRTDSDLEFLFEKARVKSFHLVSKGTFAGSREGLPTRGFR